MDVTDLSVWLAAVAVLLCSLLMWRVAARRSRVAALVNKLPGPPAYPIFGTVLDILTIPKENFMAEMLARQKRYLPIFRTWLGSTPGINIYLPEHLEVIMSSTKHLDKGSIYNLLRPWLGTGLLTSSGSKWHKSRKLLTPTFHFSILQNFVEVFCEKSSILVDKLAVHATTGECFNIYPYITRCALDIICETAMGTKVNAQDAARSEYVEAVYGIGEELTYKMLRPWLHFDFIYRKTIRGKKFQKYLDVLHGFTRQIIEERKLYTTSNPPHEELTMDYSKISTGSMRRRTAFLDLLLQSSMSNNQLTDEEIREEVDTFMFEGHDTTAAAVTWSLFLLGLHPDAQNTAYKEQQRIFQGSDRAATMQDLQEMKYLEQVIKEALRLYPSVHFIARLLKSDVQLGNYLIPAGCQINIMVYQAHRNPQYFPNPDKFNPDNFLPERVQARHPYAYIPFSAGPRNCIGQKFAMLEEKVMVSSLLREYEIQSLDDTNSMVLNGDMVLRPAHGLHVKLTLRGTT